MCIRKGRKQSHLCPYYTLFWKGNPVAKNSTALITLKGNVPAITDFIAFNFFLRENQ